MLSHCTKRIKSRPRKKQFIAIICPFLFILRLFSFIFSSCCLGRDFSLLVVHWFVWLLFASFLQYTVDTVATAALWCVILCVCACKCVWPQNLFTNISLPLRSLALSLHLQFFSNLGIIYTMSKVSICKNHSMIYFWATTTITHAISHAIRFDWQMRMNEEEEEDEKKKLPISLSMFFWHKIRIRNAKWMTKTTKKKSNKNSTIREQIESIV